MPKPRILIIDDEAAIRDSLRMTLEYEGYEFVGAATGQEGLALVERETPDLVLLDVKMPGMDGLEVLDRLRAMNDALPVVVISGHGTISTAVEATKKGAFDFVEKPFASERVLVILRNALDQGRLRGDSRGADRVGALRPRKRIVHGRDRKAGRQVRAGRPRHDFPRRSRRHERQDAGQGAPRAAGRRSGAARIGADHQGGRPRHRRD